MHCTYWPTILNIDLHACITRNIYINLFLSTSIPFYAYLYRLVLVTSQKLLLTTSTSKPAEDGHNPNTSVSFPLEKTYKMYKTRDCLFTTQIVTPKIGMVQTSEVLTSPKTDTEQSSTLRGSIHHFAPCWSLPGQSLGDHHTKWQLIQTVEEAWQPLHAGWSLKSASSHFSTFPMGTIGATPLDVSRTIPSKIPSGNLTELWKMDHL